MTIKLAKASSCAWRIGAALCAGAAAAALLSQAVAIAQEVGPLRRATAASPVAGCTADDVAGQDDAAAGIVVYPNTEIEP